VFSQVDALMGAERLQWFESTRGSQDRCRSEALFGNTEPITGYLWAINPAVDRSTPGRHHPSGKGLDRTVDVRL